MKLPVFILVHDGQGNPVFVKFDQIATMRLYGDSATLLLVNGQTIGLRADDMERVTEYFRQMAVQADGSYLSIDSPL
jgi:hypothetical protein